MLEESKASQASSPEPRFGGQPKPQFTLLRGHLLRSSLRHQGKAVGKMSPGYDWSIGHLITTPCAYLRFSHGSTDVCGDESACIMFLRRCGDKFGQADLYIHMASC